MSRDEHYSPFTPAQGPRIPTHGELLYEFLHGHTRVRCELVGRCSRGQIEALAQARTAAVECSFHTGSAKSDSGKDSVTSHSRLNLRASL